MPFLQLSGALAPRLPSDAEPECTVADPSNCTCVDRFDEVLESIVIGQRQGGDVRVVLFVRLRDEVSLDDDLRDRIRRAVRSGATPRHMPSVVAQVADIPRTRSGKMVELAVRAVVHGEEVKNIEALANPEALDYFANHPDVV